MHVLPLNPAIEDSFIKFLRRDASNFLAILDLKFGRDKSQFWIAFEDTELLGYLLEYDSKILSLRGDVRCAAELLKKATLLEAHVSIEPEHLPIFKKFYEPTRPIGPPSQDKVITLLFMEVDRGRFRPVIEHDVKKIEKSEFGAVERIYIKYYAEMRLGPIRRERIMKTLSRCSTYGVYRGNELVSFANGRILENLSHVAPVYTLPKFRGKGYAKSACSALVEELLSKSDKTVLFVPKNDAAALRVYKKVGFTETGRKFLAFWGRKL